MSLSGSNIYKSSSTTFFYKYLLTPLFGISFLAALIFVWSYGGERLLNDYKETATIIVFWALMWLTILMIRLRSAEANQDSLVIKTSKGQHIIDYKEIDWIYQAVLVRPVVISIRYRDTQTGKSRKILLIPEIGFRNHFLETEMTKFIRERITNSYPNYSNTRGPSRWWPIGLMLLTGLSGLLGMNFP